MKSITRQLAVSVGLAYIVVSLGAGHPNEVEAQVPPPFAPPTSSMAQRNALNLVLNDVRWLRNATRTASSYVGGGYGLVLQRFEAVRSQYGVLKGSLNQRQLTSGANQLAELDAGLDIIQEVFTDYQTAVANGQSASSALNNMCQVLDEAITTWAQQLRRDCGQLRVGW